MRTTLKCTEFEAATHMLKKSETGVAADGKLKCSNENELKDLLTEQLNNAGFYDQTAGVSPIKATDLSCKHYVETPYNVVRMKFHRAVDVTGRSLEQEDL